MRIAIVVLFVAVLACPVFAAPHLKIEPYEFETYDGQTIAAELGAFSVAENRSLADSRTITIKFVRFKSTAEKPGSPIVYLAGGPGGSGTGTAKGTRFPLFMALREFGDVIAFDQRGTGMTGFEDLDCDDRYMIPFDKPVDRAVAAAIVSGVTGDCIERLRESGVDVSAYNTRESAADLNDLRLALGADKITLWGISYGTHLALATMKYHEEAVDRAILAGLEALHHSWKLPSDQQALMEEIARLSNQDPAVSAVVPDLLGSIERLMAQLEESPRIIALTDPHGRSNFKVGVGKFDLQVALANMLRGPSLFSAMPDAISRLEQGDWLELALASGRERMGEGIHSMSVAMDCASGATSEWLARIDQEAEGTLLGDAINFPFPDVCAGLGIDDLGDEFRAPVRSNVPTLLISGTLDGRTPVENGTEVERYLTQAQHLVIDGAGHSDPLFLSSPDILAAMQAFLRGETIAKKRIVLPPVEFIAPRAVVALDDEALTRYEGSYQISEDETRVVRKAGNLLYTQRGRGPSLPIRPTSNTEFFYVGSSTQLKFETNDNGEVVGMVVYHEPGSEGERAQKVD